MSKGATGAAVELTDLYNIGEAEAEWHLISKYCSHLGWHQSYVPRPSQDAGGSDDGGEEDVDAGG